MPEIVVLPIRHYWSMRALRALAVALAAVICAAFAVGIRQAREVNALTALLAPGDRLTPSQQRTAASELHSAAFAYPGQDVPILAVQVALREHRFARGESLARAITRAEPDNLEGWMWLAAAGIVRPDLTAARQAREEEVRLDPIDVRP